MKPDMREAHGPSRSGRIRDKGLTSRFVGREKELNLLDGAVRRLEEGEGGAIMLQGRAGTGKSRLAAEFLASLDPGRFQVMEGRAYSWSINNPYYPLVELLGDAWNIDEDDPRPLVKEKFEAQTRALLDGNEVLSNCLGRLFDIEYQMVEEMEPESWWELLKEATASLLKGFSRRGPTIICLEDAHWADPSTVELLRDLLIRRKCPVLFVIISRPPFTLFVDGKTAPSCDSYREIRLENLSSGETREMLESLLGTNEIPSELSGLMEKREGGNPFYLEEIVNSLVESGALKLEDGVWKLSKSAAKSEMSLTIREIVTERIDNLESGKKHLLRVASVIGRAFMFEILEKVVTLRTRLEKDLNSLEDLDLIRTGSTHSDFDYVFKHAITRDVAYDGLSGEERREIHEKIGLAMEEIFAERLSEFYEALAYHFKEGRFLPKAVEYLMKSGDKSLRKYALDESQRFYEEVFDLVSRVPLRTEVEDNLLVDIILKWMMVLYYRGEFREMTRILSAHRELAESLEDRERLGAFYAWLGMTLMQRERFSESYGYLVRALKIGEETKNDEITGMASVWLAYTCSDLGRLDEAVGHGRKAMEVGKKIDSWRFPYHLALGGMGYAYWVRGESQKAMETGLELLEYGRRNSNIRGQVFGHWVKGFGYLVDGDFPSAIDCNREAISISADPWYAQFPKLHLGLSYAAAGRFDEALEPLQGLVYFCEKHGGEILGTPARGLFGAALVAGGHMSRGVKKLEGVRRYWRENNCRWRYINAEYIFGNLYRQIAERSAPITFPVLLANIGFLLKNIFAAGRKAKKHYCLAIEAAEEIGATGMLGHCCYELGLLYIHEGKSDLAREQLSRSMGYFEKSEAHTSLEKAREALSSLN